MPDDLDRIAAALAAVAGDVDARTVADAVWLAATAPPPVQRASDPADDPSRDTRNRDGTPGQASTAPRQTAAATPLSERRVSGAPARGVPVRVPVPPPLPQSAAIARALRPFTRPWRQGTATQLDVDATVERYAEHRVLTPVLRTAPERWFDVVVVVDDAPTMAVWHDTVTELIHVLARTGFFRAVHRWTLTDTDVKDHLGRTTAVADAAAMARVPNARRLMLIVSDFARTAWRGSALWELVTAWAHATPAALVDPLPVRFWAHSGMDLPAVRARAPEGPGPTTKLHFRMPLRAHLDGGSWLPVPALALTPAALDRWARTIVRADPEGCDAVLVPARWATPPPAPTTPGPAAEGFLRTAAAPAARLALLSAPFEHFSLPLLRLLQANAVPEAEPADVAELLVSGLATIDDPRAVSPVLTYHPAARDHLLDHVTADDVWTAHQTLTSFITDQPDVTPSMLALAHTPEGQQALPAEVRSFAAATTETLRLLGVLSEESPAPSGTSISGDRPARVPRSVIREEELERLATTSPIGRAPGGVFITSRSAGIQEYGALLYLELVRRFGRDLVFLDAKSIPAGVDYVQELLSRVRSAGVVLAVIGPEWLTAAGHAGGRAIDDPRDWVRRELAEAFAGGVPVIPVLIDGADLPSAADLPADIEALSRCQARPLNSSESTRDLDRLVTDLVALMPELMAAEVAAAQHVAESRVTETEPQKRKPLVHRKPVLATIRRLYGTAFRCGKPDCGRPLYKMNDDTGETLLNSRVSHICARSEGGPRWDPDMSEEENRSESNLILMCMEHADEIDVTPEHYPVELLREWKRAQIAEHFKGQKSWPLTDDEAEQVIEASFDPHHYGVAVAAASSVTAAARAVGHLVETARQQRQLPYEAASAWHAMRMRVQRSLPRAWDAATGEMLPPGEPSLMETRPFRDRLDAALLQVVETLRPLTATLVAELHAVRAAVPHLGRWCEWVEKTAGMVLMASGRWPGRPPEDDDEMLAGAIAELLRASTALSAAWQGQPAEQPPEPEPPAPDPVETDAQRQEREHRELLDRARPWTRVDTRPYDADLYAALVEAARFTLDLPELPMFITINLTATTGLAADVARNSDDDTLAGLIDDATAVQPLAIAVNLVRQLMFMAKKTQRSDLEEKAQGHAVRLLSDTDWANREVWADNRFHMRQLLGWTASVTSDDEVRDHVTAAITEQPDLLESILLSISQQTEQRDRQDWSRLLGIDVHIEDVPAWFPTSVVAAEIRRQHPDLQAADRRSITADSDLTRDLAAQVLAIESRSA